MIIEYKDLFDPNIPDKIQGLIESIKSVGTAMDEMIADVQSKSKLLSDALSGTSSSTRGGRDTTQAQAAQAEVLYNTYNQLKEATKYLADNLVALSKAQQDNKKIVDALVVSDDKFADVLSRLKAEAELAAAAIGKLGGNGDSAAIRELTARVNALQGQVKSLETAMKSAASTQSTVKTSTNAVIQETSNLGAAYASLSDLCAKTNVNLNYLLGTHKQIEQATKNGEIANKSLEGSYNQLYAQYNLIKTALNAMGKEMREDTKIGKIWEAQALDIMNKMKSMQEATGKNTLSVGDYGKALNGLNISTMQILREMPTLANSLSQFFIAISNNVPIFVDNFTRAQNVMGGFMGAVKATLATLFSWQTALLGLLTILPGIARAISQKKKAQEEANLATEKAITYAELMEKAEENAQRSIITATNKLQFLTGVIQDNNRAWDERIKAAEIMKKEWKDEFQNFTTEQILAGDATTAINNLTQALITQAKAKAYLNEIGDLSLKLYTLDVERSKASAKQKAEEAYMENLLAKSIAFRQEQQERGASMSQEEMRRRGVEWMALNDSIKEQQERIDDAAAEWLRFDYQMQDVETAITNLEKKINTFGLDPKNVTKPLQETIMDIPSYYNDALEAIIKGMQEGSQKELALLDFNFKVQREKRLEQQQKLKELMDKATKEEKDRIQKALSDLALAMVAEEQNYLEARRRMIQSFYAEEVAEEPDYEQEEIKRIKTLVDVDKRLRDQMAYNRYEQGLIALQNDEKNAKSEAELKNDLNNELLASQRKYWEDYLKMLKDSGALTVEEYNRIMQNISNLNTTPSTRRRRGRASYRNIVEAALSFSSFGEKVTDENGNTIHKIKDEYVDFVAAINNGIQTSINYMNEWMDKRIEMAELAVEKAKEEADAAKSALDIEQQARANGYANNVELARREYEEKKQIELEAIAEKKRLEKIQQAVDAATQISSLVTATANIWSAYSKLPFVGHILAAAVTALMWTSFAAAKVKAAQVTKAETHGEGMAEYLNYGGSHASGHDIDFGRTKDGRPRRVEKGEIVGVIKKRSVQKYGVERVLNFINSLNNGTFGETAENRANLAFLQSKLTDIGFGTESASMGLKMPFTDNSDSLRANYSAAFEGLKGVTDLSVLERGVGELVKQGELRVVQTSAGRIEYRGNNKRIIRNG